MYDDLTESQKKRVHHIFTSKLIHCEEDIKLLKSKETEDEVSVDPDSLKKDDFYLVSDDPDSFFYGENDALSELDDGWFWYYPSVVKDKYYTITTKRGISNDFPKKKDIINQYGTGVVIPIDTSKDYAYQTFQEGGSLEAEIIEKSKECIFYNYKDQGQIVFYVNDSGLCDMIIIQSGIFYHADKATVKRVQEKLNIIGYECGKVDGVEGKKTHNAVKKYQEDNGLYPSGIIDDSLLKRLEL